MPVTANYKIYNYLTRKSERLILALQVKSNLTSTLYLLHLTYSYITFPLDNLRRAQGVNDILLILTNKQIHPSY